MTKIREATLIIKGSSRGGSQTDIDRLARHLVAHENEIAVVLEGCGGPDDLGRQLSEFRAVTLGTRSRRALYHASLSPPADEAFPLDDPRWIEAVDTLERHLGLVGHQRVIVGHQKKARRHVHVVWCRAHPETLKIASDSHSYRKHEAASRELEERWHSSRPVTGVHTRPVGTTRPVAKATHADWQAQTRTGLQVDDIAAILKAAWASTDSGMAFAAAVKQSGLHLAIGRRGIVIVDHAGTPHSLPRRLQLRAAAVQERLADIDATTLPTVEACQQAMRLKKTSNNRRTKLSKQSMNCQAGGKMKTYLPHLFEHRDHWTGLGYEVDRVSNGWLITLSATTKLLDAGDTLTLQRSGEPTDDEIMAMIVAGKSRGWTSIRFFGGSEEYQRRARVLALKSALFTDVTLECEEVRANFLNADMPAHVRKKLMPPDAPAPAPDVPIVDTPAPVPAPELHP